MPAGVISGVAMLLAVSIVAILHWEIYAVKEYADMQHEDKQQTQPPIEVRKATAEDLPCLVRLAAQAMVATPWMTWLVGDGPDRLRRAEQLLARDFLDAFPYGMVYTTSERLGVAVWLPPETRPQSLMNQLQWGIALVRAVGLRKALQETSAYTTLAAAAPKPANYYHWTLLAIAPGHQSTGIGTALAMPGLDACDHAGAGAYAVTHSRRLITYYERFGFRCLTTLSLTPRRIPYWTAWRDPRPAAHQASHDG